MAKAKVRRLPMAAPSPSFYDPARDGVTQSLLSAFKRCRQLARESLAGWTGRHASFPLVYGGLVHHVLHQAYKPVLVGHSRTVPSAISVNGWLTEARNIWIEENPIRSDITTNIFEESLMKAGAILPSYFKYWKTDFTQRAWVGLESTFRIPWFVTGPDGRVYDTFLRGKIDGAFLRPKAKRHATAPRLMETKTRTDINEEELELTLPMNTQTSVYLLALQHMSGQMPREVEYNIIRKTALRQGKNESWQSYEQRIIDDIKSRLDWYFVRMSMTIDADDLARMKSEIDALVLDFLLWWNGQTPHYPNDQSCYLFRRPCDMLRKCARDDTSQLFKRPHVFSELEE